MGLSISINDQAAFDVVIGVPGPAGPAGPAGATGPQGQQGVPGVGVPAGGTEGQVLAKVDGVDYNTEWVDDRFAVWGLITGNLADQLDLQQVLDGKYSVLNPAGYITASALNGYATEPWVTSQLGSYLTTASAASLYAPLAHQVPAGGTTGQILAKSASTDWSLAWTTIIPGDRYLTTSSTSNAVSNGSKTFTVGTGLSYSPTQDLTIAYDASNHMHGSVTSYDSGTGVLVVDIQNHTGSGTYSSWTVNVGGTTPVASVAWGDITGTIGNQSDLSSALNAKLDITTAASTYYPLTNPSGYITSSALTGYATESWVSSQGYLTDAPSDSQTYGRQNGGWVVTGGTSVTNNSQLDTTVSTVTDASIYVSSGTYPRNQILNCVNGGNVDVYLNTGYAAGDQILFINQTGSVITFNAGGGASVLAANGTYCTKGSGGVVAAVAIDSSTWVISGDLTPTV